MADDDKTAGDLDADDPQAVASYWHIELALAEKDQRDYVDDGRKYVARYKSEKATTARSSDTRRLNIFYSNTETLRAALYGRTAKPDVRRRFADRDPVGRAAADIIERSLIYVTDVGDVDGPIDLSVLDHLTTGRGVVRVEYEPIIKTRAIVDQVTGAPMVDAEGETATEEFIADQKLHSKYVYWEDFRCSSARGWQGVWWIAFRHAFTRDELDEQVFANAPEASRVYGEAKDVPLNWAPDVADRNKLPEHLKKAEVWEIWHRPDKKRYWMVDGYGKPLRIDDDPYGLEGFYPLPEPLRGYAGTDTIVPQAELMAYEDQANDLDEINRRISILTKALKRRGVYDQSIKELAQLKSAGDNQFIPVENYGSLTAKGGLTAAFQTEDISLIATVLDNLYGQADKLIQRIYEITGIADILRGASDPDETLGAQKIKAQFGSARLKRRQRGVQRFVRDLYRIKGEIIVKHFRPEILTQITGIQVTPEIWAVLSNESQRGYRIDIETDSTIFEDAEAQQQQRSSMIEALTRFVVAWGPVIMQRPQLMPLAFECLSWSVRVFPASRELEEAIEEAKTALMQAAAQAPPQQNPALQIAQIKAQGEAVKSQASVQTAQIQAQAKAAEAGADAQRAAATTQAQVAKHQMDLAAAAQQHELAMNQMHHEAAAKATLRMASQPAPAPMGAPPPMARPPVQPARIPYRGAVRPRPDAVQSAKDGLWYVPHALGAGVHGRVDHVS